MAKEVKKITNFYADNTVEIVINGKKHRVNKFEAAALKKKLVKKPAKTETDN